MTQISQVHDRERDLSARSAIRETIKVRREMMSRRCFQVGQRSLRSSRLECCGIQQREIEKESAQGMVEQSKCLCMVTVVWKQKRQQQLGWIECGSVSSMDLKVLTIMTCTLVQNGKM